MMETNEVLMTLVIKGARKLKNTQTLGLQDPYLRAWVSGSKNKQMVKTKTYVDGGSMAIWNESSELKVTNRKTDCLFIEIKNENDFTSDAIIGRLKLPCADIPETPVEDWYSIYGERGDIAGEVHLSLSIKENKSEDALNMNELRISIDPNMSTSTSKKDLPKPPADLSDEAMPQGWVIHHTKTGCPYFINEDTETTTWIDPRKVGFRS